MSCLHLHLCRWCQPGALGAEALCPGVGCRRGFASEGLGQQVRGKRGCNRVFCPTGSCIVGPGVHRQGPHSSYPAREPQVPPCPLAAPPQRCRSLSPRPGKRVPMQSRPGRPAAPHRRAAKIMNKLLLINTL